MHICVCLSVYLSIYLSHSKWANGDAKTLKKTTSNLHKQPNITMVNIYTETKNCNPQRNLACLTVCWWFIKGHINSDLNKQHNNDVVNAIIPLGYYKQGQLNKLARHFGISRQTTSALWTWYNTTQSINDRSRSGHHRVTTTAQDWYICMCHIWNWTKMATTTVTQIPGLHRISDQTVHNWLSEAGILTGRPVWHNVVTYII